jgi:hypothetical protein
LTFFAAASHASLSVWPGSRQANQMTVTSGLRLLESLPSCDRELWWLRTLLGSSVWHSTRCLLIWKHKVTPQGRSYYLLRVSMPRTGETASGLRPTPQAQLAKHGTPSPAQMNRHDSLDTEVFKAIPEHSGMKLSAAWVTRMQGFPDGWLDVP